MLNSYFQLADKLQKTTTKTVRLRNYLKFLRRCRNNDIIPQGLRVKLFKDEVMMRSVSTIKSRLEITRLRSRIKTARRKMFFTQQQMREIYTELKEKITDQDYAWLEKVIMKSKKIENKRMKEKHIRKYESLVEEKRKIKEKQKETLEDQQKMKETKIKTA